MNPKHLARVWLAENAHLPPEMMIDHPGIAGFHEADVAAEVAGLLREQAAAYEAFAQRLRGR